MAERIGGEVVGEEKQGETRRESGCLCFAWISLFVSSRWLEREKNAFPWIFPTHEKKRRDDEVVMMMRLKVAGFGVGLVDLTWSP